ncbi:MAG TPA: DNA repair protein RadC [Candidatus Sphingobacterium stercorigallinarum]|nr:DNA repair protein RadC [Candidatus Sphingobacterium stercorigallinarum]
MSKMIIRNWAREDRPREKLMAYGRRKVTDAELMASLIGSGNADETAVELCRRILASLDHDLVRLSKLTVQELCEFKGVGPAKAVAITAALELGRRRQKCMFIERPLVNSSTVAYDYLRADLQDLTHEEFWVMYLNGGCRVIDKQMISMGGNDFTPVDLRVILQTALMRKATALIVAHNHPSGTLTPSLADRQLTQRMQEATELVDLRLHDHIIITDSDYYSFRDQGHL